MLTLQALLSLRRQTRQESLAIALPDPLARSAYQAKYFGLFWESYLPYGRLLPPAITTDCDGAWATILWDLSRRHPTIHQALLAISLTSAGTRDGQRWMREEGLKLYGIALAKMGTALRDPTSTKTEEMIIATRLLALFEVGANPLQDSLPGLRLIKLRSFATERMSRTDSPKASHGRAILLVLSHSRWQGIPRPTPMDLPIKCLRSSGCIWLVSSSAASEHQADANKVAGKSSSPTFK